jgi:hypothetical protein
MGLAVFGLSALRSPARATIGLKPRRLTILGSHALIA